MEKFSKEWLDHQIKTRKDRIAQLTGTIMYSIAQKKQRQYEIDMIQDDLKRLEKMKPYTPHKEKYQHHLVGE
jgi:hypothetical protein